MFAGSGIAREWAVLGLGREIRSALEDSHGTGNGVGNRLGKAVNGLSEHSVDPCYGFGNAYATQPSRNAT